MKKTGFVLILLISIISNSFIFSYDLGKLELKNKIKIKKRMYNSIKYYKKIYYLSNFRNAKIEMFDKNFNLLKKILSKGKGPGEIFSMMGKTNFIFDIKNRKIIVFDILAQRLHLYDIKGKFIETYNVNRAKKISRFKILDNNKIIFKYMGINTNKLFSIYKIENNDEKELNYQLEVNGNLIKKVISKQCLFEIDKNYLFITKKYSNEIIKYNYKKNKITKKITLDEFVKKPRIYISKKNIKKNKPAVYDIKLIDGTIFILISGKKDKQKSKYLISLNKNLKIKKYYILNNKIFNFDIFKNKIVCMTNNNIILYKINY